MSEKIFSVVLEVVFALIVAFLVGAVWNGIAKPVMRRVLAALTTKPKSATAKAS